MLKLGTVGEVEKKCKLQYSLGSGIQEEWAKENRDHYGWRGGIPGLLQESTPSAPLSNERARVRHVTSMFMASNKLGYTGDD